MYQLKQAMCTEDRFLLEISLGLTRHLPCGTGRYFEVHGDSLSAAYSLLDSGVPTTAIKMSRPVNIMLE